MIKIGKREITVFLLCIVIGILLVIQIRADNSGNMYVSASEIDDYIAQIESERANIDAIKEQIEESKRQLADYEESAKEKDNATIQAKLTSELESFRSMSCADAMRGSGVKIVVDDGTRPLYEGEDINDIIVHDITVRQVGDLVKPLPLAADFKCPLPVDDEVADARIGDRMPHLHLAEEERLPRNA